MPLAHLYDPKATTSERAMATLHAMRLRRLMDWGAYRAFASRDEAMAARHNLGAAMANTNTALPHGWTVGEYWVAGMPANYLAIFNPAGTRLMLI